MNDILKTFIYCFILSSLFSTIVLSQNPDLVASFGNLEDNENEFITFLNNLGFSYKYSNILCSRLRNAIENYKCLCPGP